MKDQRDDVLNEMTKAELVEWIRRKCWGRIPRRSDALFIRWELQTQALDAEETKAIEEFKSSVNLKERDRLAKLFNASTDLDERARLIKKIADIDRKVAAHFEHMKVIDKKRQKADRLYQQAMAAMESEKETSR